MWHGKGAKDCIIPGALSKVTFPPDRSQCRLFDLFWGTDREREGLGGMELWVSIDTQFPFNCLREIRRRESGGMVDGCF